MVVAWQQNAGDSSQSARFNFWQLLAFHFSLFLPHYKICITLYLPEAGSIHKKDEKKDQSKTEAHSEPFLCSQCSCFLQLVVISTQTKQKLLFQLYMGTGLDFRHIANQVLALQVRDVAYQVLVLQFLHLLDIFMYSKFVKCNSQCLYKCMVPM